MDAPPTFDAQKHGPLLWPELGWPWNPRELATARLFDGWEAPRLAAVLGLPVRRVTALLAPPGRATSRVPQVGELRLTGQRLWLRPRGGGGFDGALRGSADAYCLGPGYGAEVLAVQHGRGLLRLMRGSGPDLLVWVRLGDCVRLWGAAVRA